MIKAIFDKEILLEFRDLMIIINGVRELDA